MNEAKPNIVISVLLIFISAYLFLLGLGVGREGGNWYPYFLIFIFSLLINLLYYIWYGRKTSLKQKFALAYIPWAVILFIFLIWLVLSRPWVKYVRWNMGADPYSQGMSTSGITSGARFTIFQKEFWSASANEEARLEHLKEMQIARQGSLFDHMGYEFQGWSAEKIRYAYSDPAEIIKIDDHLEKWIYHPWTNHRDWEMPIYVKDGFLYKIGD